MPDFSKRWTGAEIMDDLNCSGADLDRALNELDTINKWLGGNAVTLSALDHLLQGYSAAQPLRIADLGCGSGDMLRLIRRRLSQQRAQLTLTGIDANPNVVDFAKARAGASGIRFEVMNIFSDTFKTQRFDVVTATLFFHHFPSGMLAALLRQLSRQVSVGIVINDLHRHWLAYYSIQWITALFSRSAMVRNDAPLSVLRAFSKSELRDILEKAGIRNYRIRWRWAFRWQVIISFR